MNGALENLEKMVIELRETKVINGEHQSALIRELNKVGTETESLRYKLKMEQIKVRTLRG